MRSSARWTYGATMTPASAPERIPTHEPHRPHKPRRPRGRHDPRPRPSAPAGQQGARVQAEEDGRPPAAPRKYPRPVAGEAPSTDKPARPYVRPVDRPAVGAGAVSAGGTMPATVGVSLKATPTSPFRPKLPQKKPPAKAPTAKGAVVSAASAAPVGPARVQVGAVPCRPAPARRGDALALSADASGAAAAARSDRGAIWLGRGAAGSHDAQGLKKREKRSCP